jgi:hypothetical protein
MFLPSGVNAVKGQICPVNGTHLNAMSSSSPSMLRASRVVRQLGHVEIKDGAAVRF